MIVTSASSAALARLSQVKAAWRASCKLFKSGDVAMLEPSTLVVVADRTKARFLARPAHREGLVELAGLGMKASLAPGEHHPDEVSGFFLADMASQISDAMRNTSSTRLVLCAEAEALASLRSFLGSSYLPGMAILAANIVSETPEEVSRRLSADGVLH